MSIRSIHSKNFQDSSNQSLLKQIPIIQKGLQLNLKRDYSQGFLVTIWSLAEIESFLKTGSVFYFALSDDEKLMGYVLISGIDKFLKQLEGNPHTVSLSLFSGDPSYWKYLYQIAIDPAFARQGIGRKLYSHARDAYPGKRIVSDYMLSPAQNVASAQFFKDQHFQEAGTLGLEAYRGFVPSKWQIVVTEQVI